MGVRVINTVRTGQELYDDRIRWLEATNQGAETIPSFGVCRSVGASNGIIYVNKPNADSQAVLINGPVPILSNGTGRVTWETPVYALYDTDDGTPNPGEEWGAANDSFELSKGKTGFVVDGGVQVTEEAVMVTRASGVGCVIPIFMRIDGGDGSSGYEWTAMQQDEADPGSWEESSAGYTDVTTNAYAYEANGASVTAGATIYQGWYDQCRGAAFFFGSNADGRAIIVFDEDAPSFGELYLATIYVEVVESSTGLVSWTPGIQIYAFSINNSQPTLETKYFARRSEGGETVDGKMVFTVDRCCDGIGDQSSSGPGGDVILCNGEEWPRAFSAVYYSTFSGQTVTLTLTYYDSLDQWIGSEGSTLPGDYYHRVTGSCTEGLGLRFTAETYDNATSALDEYTPSYVASPGDLPVSFTETTANGLSTLEVS